MCFNEHEHSCGSVRIFQTQSESEPTALLKPMPFASRFLPWTILALLCPVAHLAELGDRAAHTTTARCARSLEALEEVYEKILEGAESCDIRAHEAL